MEKGRRLAGESIGRTGKRELADACKRPLFECGTGSRRNRGNSGREERAWSPSGERHDGMRSEKGAKRWDSSRVLEAAQHPDNVK